MALLGRFCILKTMEDLVGNVVVLEDVVLEETVDGERAVEKRFLLKILTLI